MLARAGKRVLRPGGLGLTRAMLGRCSLGDKDVIELAPGLGRTAKEILSAAPSSYTGVDGDATAAARVNEVVKSSGGSCLQGDAAKTGLGDACADAVIGEAMLTMQSPRGKAEIVTEAARLLRPGGIYAIHELGLTPDDIDPQWSELLTVHGLVVEWTSTAPMSLLKLGRNFADEGVTGVLRMAKNLIVQPDLRRRVMSMRRTFTTYESSMRGVALVARKPS